MILGITGKSGTGKHTASDFLSQKGWVILNADKIAHHLYRPYTRVWKNIVERFGEGILAQNDKIDRQKLGKIVFGENKEKELNALNEIIHPEIKRYLKEEIHHLHRKKKNIAIVAALWDKIDLTEICDRLLLVTADHNLAYGRVKKRDGIDEALYLARTGNQEAPPNPDFTIENNDDFQDFYRKINELPIHNIEES